jgi:hypothetical protein
VALVVGALLLTNRLLWTPGLTEENVRRIQPGMALAEVEELLGGPSNETIDWQAEGAAVDVQFFAVGRVMAAAGGKQTGPGPLARLWAWLGW